VSPTWKRRYRETDRQLIHEDFERYQNNRCLVAPAVDTVCDPKRWRFRSDRRRKAETLLHAAKSCKCRSARAFDLRARTWPDYLTCKRTKLRRAILKENPRRLGFLKQLIGRGNIWNPCAGSSGHIERRGKPTYPSCLARSGSGASRGYFMLLGRPSNRPASARQRPSVAKRSKNLPIKAHSDCCRT